MPKNNIEIWAPVTVAPASSAAPKGRDTRNSAVGTVSIKGASGHAASSSDRSKITEAVSEKFRAYTVPMSQLSNNLKQTLSDFQQLMEDLPKPASGYCIDEIELHLGINGNGGIALIGKLTVGMEAAIKVKIKRLP